MNGGRLSDDEAFARGIEELRAHLTSPDSALAERACNRIAVRFPEEADTLRTAALNGDRVQCTALLAELETRYREELADD